MKSDTKRMKQFELNQRVSMRFGGARPSKQLSVEVTKAEILI